MKSKILNYFKRKKLLCILLGVYIVLCISSLIYLHYRGEELVTSNSPIAKTQNQGVGKNPSKKSNSSKEKSNSKSNNSSSDSQDSSQSNSSSSSNTGSSSGDDDSSSNDLTSVVAFYSDTQEDTDTEDANHTRVVEYLLGSGANPIFHAGDVMEDGTQASMDRFASVTEALRAARSFYAALGNNDRAGGSPSPIFLNFFGQGTHYSVNSGNLHVAVLDSAFESMAPGSSQYNWLSSDLDSVDQSKITAVVFHHPDKEGQVSALLSQKHVDFVMMGHVHSFGESTNDGVYYFTLSGQPSIGYIKAYIYENNAIIKAYDSDNGLIGTYNIPNR